MANPGGDRHSLRCLLDDADFPSCQAVELVDQLVDLIVNCVDLTLDELLVVCGLGFASIPVKLQHTVNEFDHAVVTGFVGGVGEVNRADGELLDELCEVAEEPAPHGRADALQVEVEKQTVQQGETVLRRFLHVRAQGDAVTTRESIVAAFV